MQRCETLLLVLLCGSCRCGANLEQLHAVIAVDPDHIDFAAQDVGQPTTALFQVGNRGTGALTIDARVTGDAFALDAAPDHVAAGLAERGQVRFTPPAEGSFAGSLVMTSDDETHPTLIIPLTGEGGPPELTITPNPVDFGLVNEGPGATRAVTLANTGHDTLHVESAKLENGSAFTLDSSTLPADVAPGGSVDVHVSLRPRAGMDHALTDRIVVTHAAGQGTAVVEANINLAPVAVAVEMITRRTVVKVGVGTDVVVDGSETHDPEGDPFSYVWSLTQQPGGSIAALVGQGQPTTQVTPDVVGDYDVTLRAIDVHGAYSDASVQILPRDLSIVLTWIPAGDAGCGNGCGQSDLDLHLVAPNGSLGDYGTCPAGCDPSFCGELDDSHLTCRQSGTDCAYANRAPEWGQPGRIDDPRLDVDDVRGYGPEIISLDDPEDGDYRVVVHYCLDRLGDEPSLATIQVIEQGVVSFTSEPQHMIQNDAWTAATLVRSNGSWQIVAPPGVVETAPAGLCTQ
jgi:hypothetical protein